MSFQANFKLKLRSTVGRILRNTGMLPVYRGAAQVVRDRSSSARKTKMRLKANMGRSSRLLEIGPGPSRIPEFETLNVVNGSNVDYVWDATSRLPFPNETFDIIYASHILEHVPWYQTDEVLREWVRILKHAGRLEVWVPDGLKICKAFIDAELNDDNYIERDGWYRWNEERDPCKWAAGRIFTYGDGAGTVEHPNWHRALFSPRYLRKVLEHSGLTDVRQMASNEVRGYDHGWINLGMCGTRP